MQGYHLISLYKIYYKIQLMFSLLEDRQKRPIGVKSHINNFFKENQAILSKQSSLRKFKSEKDEVFLPYIKERNGIGKLIKANKPNQQKNKKLNKNLSQSPTNNHLSQSPTKNKIKNEGENENKINFSKFHKNQIKAKENQKEKVASESRRREFITKEIQKNGLPKSLREIIYEAPYEISNEEENMGFRLKKSNSMVLKKTLFSPRDTTVTLPQTMNTSRMFKKEDTNVVPDSLMKECEKELNQKLKKFKTNGQYPEMKRFRQMQKLSIKVINNFEDTHSQFLKKIVDTKLQVIKIKRQLEID